MSGRWWVLAALGAVVAWSGLIRPAQAQSSVAGRLLVMPFETSSREPKTFWLSEGSALLLTEELGSLGADPIARDERLRAFERLGVTPVATLTEATLIRLGQLVGAAQVVLGSLDLSGTVLTVRARSIRLEVGRMDAEVVERAELGELFAIFHRLAGRLLPGSTGSAREADPPRPPLAAFENYVKGLLAETSAQQISFLQTALTLAPEYGSPRLALWTVHTDQGDHERAWKAVDPVPESSVLGRRARFLRALSELSLKRYDAAVATFKALLEKSTSAESFNNLGVIALRRGGPVSSGEASSYFKKASEADPDDPDYFFNLGYAYWVERDLPAAMYWLREAVRRNPADGDAHFVLGTALQVTGSQAQAVREKELARRLSSRYAEWERRPVSAEIVPRGLERVKTGPEMPKGQRIELALAANEQRDHREVAAFHLDSGRRLFDQRRDSEAIVELQRSLYLAPYQAEAHLLLGRIYLRTGRVPEAIDTLKISLWSEDTAAAHVALGEAYLQASNQAAARAEADRALAINPASGEARNLLERANQAPVRPSTPEKTKR